MERYQTFYWTPCTTYCIELMLKVMDKTPWIKEIVESAKSVTIYILSYLCSYTHQTVHKEQKLVHPAIIRFTTGFISL
jgi:hypothetical protein